MQTNNKCSFLTQVDAHEEVSGSQITDEESGNVHFAAGEDQHEDHGSISKQSEEEDNPDATSQCPPVEQILAGQKRT